MPTPDLYGMNMTDKDSLLAISDTIDKGRKLR